MAQMYVDLLDNNKIVSRDNVADTRKQCSLRNVADIPENLFESLNIDKVSVDQASGNKTGFAFKNAQDLWEVEYTPFTAEQKMAIFERAVQETLDTKAVELGYDSIYTAVTYADEASVSKFQQEGQALRAWRSQCWDYAYTTLNQVQGGQIPEPTVEEFLAGLPTFTQPA